MIHRSPETTDPQYLEVFTFAGPRDEAAIPSSIANMCARGSDRRFVIDEGHREIVLEFQDGRLFAVTPNYRSDFWLNGIVNCLMHPLPAEFFGKSTSSSEVRVERSNHGPVVVQLSKMAPRVR
jgi:hypothetical protein